MKYISFVSGAAVALLQFFQPLNKTWIGHDHWASDNLLLAAYIGAPIGALLFFIGPLLPRVIQFIILGIVSLGFLGGLTLSVYCSQTITSIPDISDQIFWRETVWKLAHLTGTMCLTILLFCLSLLERR